MMFRFASPFDSIHINQRRWGQESDGNVGVGAGRGQSQEKLKQQVKFIITNCFIIDILKCHV